MLKETSNGEAKQSPHQRKYTTTQLALLVGLIYLTMANLLGCSGGSSSQSETTLASVCVPPSSSGSPPTSNLTSLRGGHTATLLPNGMVLVAGGSGSAGVLASAETVIPSNRIQATLTWNTVSDPSVLGYKIYYGTAPNTYQQVIDTGLSTTYAFSNLQKGTTYYFSVTSYHFARESCASNEVSKTVP